MFEEMQAINAEVVAAAMSQNWETAEHWIPIYEDWSRKLEIGAFLRGRPVDEARRRSGDAFRDALEQLEHAMQDQQADEARELGPGVEPGLPAIAGRVSGPMPPSEPGPPVRSGSRDIRLRMTHSWRRIGLGFSGIAGGERRREWPDRSQELLLVPVWWVST